jgi:predicted adenine nucleotide alpha hydrolase (AANH) superfamily ATPase
MRKPRLLLHMCCAPCSTHVINILKTDYQLEAYFYNPNIHPADEYSLRHEEAQAFADKVKVPIHCGEYDPSQWFRLVKGHESDREGGERCRICYEHRLRKTAEKAAAEGFDLFTTTLTVSLHKKAEAINAIGRRLAQRYGVKFLAADFKKRDGFKKSVELSRVYGLRRQRYCGCVFSIPKQESGKG